MNKLILVLLTFIVSIRPAWSTEIIHYDNLPVTIELRKGEERSIQFGDHVQFGMTKGQQLKRLFRIQAAQGAVHILPYEEFDKQRVQIKRISDGRVILIDLIAMPAKSDAPELEDIRIFLDTDDQVGLDSRESAASKANSLRPTITPVDLTRHAAQHLYGPSRLHRDRLGINTTPVGLKGLIRVF